MIEEGSMKHSRWFRFIALSLFLALLAGGLAPAVHAGATSAFKPVPVDALKVGMVLIGLQDDGFSGAHYNGLEGMKTALGLKDEQVLYKFNVPETAECDAALRELVDAGCQIILATPGDS